MFGASADLPRIIELDLDKIQPNPNQPRKIFDETSLRELADSIEATGLLQPILVKPIDGLAGTYEIVAGERRFRAHGILGRTTIAAVIANGNTDEIAIVENVQREDLKPMELAESLDRLMQTHGYTQEVVAKVIGKARSTVTELLSLNKLPEVIKAECRTSDMTEKVSKSFLIQLAKLDYVAQLVAWERFKAGETEVLKAGKPVKALSVAIPDAVADVSLTKKPKRVFHTQHQATVIVQADGDALEADQVNAALEDAFEQSCS